MVNWRQPEASLLGLMLASCVSDIKVALGFADDKNRGYAYALGKDLICKAGVQIHCSIDGVFFLHES